MLNVMCYRINFDVLFLKNLDINEEFEFDLIVTKDDVAFDEKTL